MKITVQDQLNKMRKTGKNLQDSSQRREERRKDFEKQSDSVIIDKHGLAGALSSVLTRLNQPIGSKVQGHSRWFPKR